VEEAAHFSLYSARGGPQLRFTKPYGKSQEETPAEDEQAQAPKALEEQSPQKAHVAEVKDSAAKGGGAIIQ